MWPTSRNFVMLARSCLLILMWLSSNLKERLSVIFPGNICPNIKAAFFRGLCDWTCIVLQCLAVEFCNVCFPGRVHRHQVPRFHRHDQGVQWGRLPQGMAWLPLSWKMGSRVASVPLRGKSGVRAAWPTGSRDALSEEQAGWWVEIGTVGCVIAEHLVPWEP